MPNRVLPSGVARYMRQTPSSTSQAQSAGGEHQVLGGQSAIDLRTGPRLRTGADDDERRGAVKDVVGRIFECLAVPFEARRLVQDADQMLPRRADRSARRAASWMTANLQGWVFMADGAWIADSISCRRTSLSTGRGS